jgi:hypothetical protein
MNDDRMSIGQTVGILLFVFSAGIPGMHLSGFWSGTSWPLPVWLLISLIGGVAGGALLAPANRIAGAAGGFVAGPLGLLAVYLYAHGRTSIYKMELVLVQGVASLPGFGVYFLVRLLINAIVPTPETTGRGRRSRRLDLDDEDDRPQRRRRREEDYDDEDEPRSRRRRDDEDEDEDEERPARRRRSRYGDE